MDDSPEYKQWMDKRWELHQIWEPEIGDFWYCACESCINSNRLWVIEQADFIAIHPEIDLNNYYRDVVQATHTSLDCGFGAFWRDNLETKERGYVWLPRIDQLIEISSKEFMNRYDVTLKHFYQWYHACFNDFSRFEKMPTFEQAILYWMEVTGVINKIQNNLIKKEHQNEAGKESPLQAKSA